MTFTLPEAQRLLPRVVRISERYTDDIGRYELMRKNCEDASKCFRISQIIDEHISQWAYEISLMGCEPKGLWTVDFDSGKGYFYCWHYPETRLEFFHRYEDGFSGRQPIPSDSPGF